ncbi:MAG: hypothetical protein OEM52_02060 [bacterium]|nr:hypothetical protein [bacterium]
MKSTIRLWSSADLDNIRNNVDPFLTTVFLNKKTFSLAEIRAYPYHLRKTFVIDFDGGEIVTVYATDVDSLHRFLATEYRSDRITSISEYHITFTDVAIQKGVIV